MICNCPLNSTKISRDRISEQQQIQSPTIPIDAAAKAVTQRVTKCSSSISEHCRASIADDSESTSFHGYLGQQRPSTSEYLKGSASTWVARNDPRYFRAEKVPYDDQSDSPQQQTNACLPLGCKCLRQSGGPCHPAREFDEENSQMSQWLRNIMVEYLGNPLDVLSNEMLQELALNENVSNDDLHREIVNKIEMEETNDTSYDEETKENCDFSNDGVSGPDQLSH